MKQVTKKLNQINEIYIYIYNEYVYICKVIRETAKANNKKVSERNKTKNNKKDIIEISIRQMCSTTQSALTKKQSIENMRNALHP